MYTYFTDLHLHTRYYYYYYYYTKPRLKHIIIIIVIIIGTCFKKCVRFYHKLDNRFCLNVYYFTHAPIHYKTSKICI